VSALKEFSLCHAGRLLWQNPSGLAQQQELLALKSVLPPIPAGATQLS